MFAYTRIRLRRPRRIAKASAEIIIWQLATLNFLVAALRQT
jgi:hypothetical protein